MAKRVARHFFAPAFDFLDDVRHARAFGNEEVHAVVLVHDFAEAGGFGFNVERHFGNVNAVNFAALVAEAEFRHKIHFRDQLVIFHGGGGGEPTAVAAHDFVDDEHARVGVVFGNDVAEIAGALFGGRPGTEGLANWIHVVVDGLGQADDGEAVIVFCEESGEVGGGGIGIVTTDGVEDVNAVFDELVGGDFLRVLAFFDEAALYAVFDVGEFNAAVADG